MVSTNLLASIMAFRGETQTSVAKAIGISNKTMSNRMKSGIFKSNEIAKLIDYLEIDNPMEVFFANFGTDRHSKEESREND